MRIFFLFLLTSMFVTCTQSEFSGASKSTKKSVPKQEASQVVAPTPTPVVTTPTPTPTPLVVDTPDTVRVRIPTTQVFDNPRCPDGSVIEYCQDFGVIKPQLDMWCQWKGFETATARTNKSGEINPAPSECDCGITGFSNGELQIVHNSCDNTSWDYCLTLTCVKYEIKELGANEPIPAGAEVIP